MRESWLVKRLHLRGAVSGSRQGWDMAHGARAVLAVLVCSCCWWLRRDLVALSLLVLCHGTRRL